MGVRQLEKLTSKGTRRSMPSDEEAVRSEGQLRHCMCMRVSAQGATGEKKDPGWVDCVSKLLGGVCLVTGKVHRVHGCVLLCARKSVPAA